MAKRSQRRLTLDSLESAQSFLGNAQGKIVAGMTPYLERFPEVGPDVEQILKMIDLISNAVEKLKNHTV